MTIKPLSKPLKLAHLYLISSHDEAESKKQREMIRDQLKPLILNMEQDENGNYLYEFPDALCIDEVWYKGLMMQRKVSEFVNEEKARELIWKKDLTDRCLRTYTVSELDLDEIYAANQEGLLSDEEIDSIIDTTVNFALVKVKG